MNINPDSERFGDVVPWDSLTEDQQASGDWIELPPVNNEPRRGRRERRTSPLLDALISGLPPYTSDRGSARAFDATGKAR